MTHAPASDAETAFLTHRPRAFAVAYRMLGSIAEAEDVVQEAWLRWQGADRAHVASPEAFIVTTTSRLAIDHLRKASTRRETYVGPWLPEPMVTGDAESPATPQERLELADDISMALLHLLERLSPEERAAFLLHEAFDYSHAEIANLIGKSEAACRQMLSRARKRVQAERPRFNTEAREHARLTELFQQALMKEDPEAILACMKEDAIFYSDGGGKVAAALNPLYGADKITRFWLGIMRKAEGRITPRPAWLNGLPGYLLTEGDTLHSAVSLRIEDGRIAALYVQRNPDKLADILRWTKLRPLPV
ncbi:sigma-70 family RNA polymerase sigma factor [Parvibaculum sp. MBR-TMA-1.3b-4.2]